MFDSIATATIEMAGTAILATWFAHVLGNFGQIRWLDNLAAAFRKLAWLIQRVSGICGNLLVGACRVVAG